MKQTKMKIGGLYKYHQCNNVLPYFDENEILFLIKIEQFKGAYNLQFLTKKGLKSMYSSASHIRFECLI
jgi:hypothetical protein